jgi:hypothetical protein
MASGQNKKHVTFSPQEMQWKTKGTNAPSEASNPGDNTNRAPLFEE